MARLLSLPRPDRLVERARSASADERGIGVPTALFVAVTVFLLGATWAQLGVHNVSLSTHERSREQALDAAEAGINRAMSSLTVDAAYAGGSGTLDNGAGSFDVTVTPIDTGNPQDVRRKIVSTGYGRTASGATAVTRRMEAEVDLETTDGFDFGLFAGAGSITGANHMTVNGDLYSSTGIDIDNNSDIQGDVVTPAWVTTSNNTLVAGDIRADGDVTLENTSTTVQGSVLSRGSVYVHAHVLGDVQAGGTVTVPTGGTVEGTIAQSSNPPPVRVESLPTFTWDPNNYTPAPANWSTVSAFYSDWSAKAVDNLPFNGHHRINSTSPLTLDKKWKMSADVTIVSDGKISLTKEISNTSSSTLTLVIISLSEEGIEFSGNVTIPDSIRVLLFAPNGPVAFHNLKHFTGAVYGESITVDQNFTLTWARPVAPGFSWTTATEVHHRVVVRVLREMTV